MIDGVRRVLAMIRDQSDAIKFEQMVYKQNEDQQRDFGM